LEILLSFAVFFLFFLALSEDFPKYRQRLQAFLQERPRWKYLAYPLGALLLAGTAALFFKNLINFANNLFSYD